MKFRESLREGFLQTILRREWVFLHIRLPEAYVLSDIQHLRFQRCKSCFERFEFRQCPKFVSKLWYPQRAVQEPRVSSSFRTSQYSLNMISRSHRKHKVSEHRLNTPRAVIEAPANLVKLTKYCCCGYIPRLWPCYSYHSHLML